MKKVPWLVFLSLALVLSGCGRTSSLSSASISSEGPSLGSSSSTEVSSSQPVSSSSSSDEPASYAIEGIADTQILQGHFFSPLDGVSVRDSAGKDVGKDLIVSGNVNYGVVGDYVLTYQIGNLRKSRTVSVLADPSYGQSEAPYIYTSSSLYNIALDQKCVAPTRDSASPASNLSDGDRSTRWESPWDDGPYDIIVDLGADLDYSRVDLYWENASAKSYALFQSKDNVTYDLLTSRDDGVYGSHKDSLSVTGTKRYLKLHLTNRTTAYGYSLYEIEVFGLRGLPVPQSEYPDLFVSKAIADEQSLTLDLGASEMFDQLSLNYYDYLAAVSLDLSSSNDGQEYTLIQAYSAGESDLHFSSTSARYLKVSFHSRPFNSKNYKISLLTLKNAAVALPLTASMIRVSSIDEGHEAANVLQDYNTYWGSLVSPLDADGQVIDLGAVTSLGKAVGKWANNYGKVYDLYCLTDLDSFASAKPFYRQLHGASAVQSIDIYSACRYLIFVDHSNNNANRYQLTALSVHSPLPNEKPLSYTIGALPVEETVAVGSGSYLRGNPAKMEGARGIAYRSDSLSGACDSNSWWNSLLINNYGHAMYLNPLRAKYSADGLGISYPGEGYFETTYRRSQTVTDTVDLSLSSSSINKIPTTEVLAYDDFGVRVHFSDDASDKMVNSLYQGSPFVFSYFAAGGNPVISCPSLKSVQDLEGNSIQGTFAGDSLLLTVSSYVGYVGGVQTSEASKLYEDHTYLLAGPSDSTFTIESDKITLAFAHDNFLSIGLVPSLAQAKIYHDSAFSFIEGGRCSYEVSKDNVVTTHFAYLTHQMATTSMSPIIALLPHQWKKAEITPLAEYRSVRGTMKAMAGNSFETQQVFAGISPIYDEPTDATYSHADMLTYLKEYDAKTAGNNLSADAYWQGKALHPLANALWEADQLGANNLRDSFLGKLEAILCNWFTYDGPTDQEYFYYDDEWGTLYYAVSEFGANFNLADHHFTYGYFALAMAAVSEFDPAFLSAYGSMAELLIKDYMNYSDDVSTFCRFRNYDLYAGHSWAGGYADSDGGNNQESAGEALNSWASAYLYSRVSGNEQMRKAAIFGYTSELNAIKDYWFNYDGDAYSNAYPYAGVGQIYGGSNFYGTFFNGDPTYIYGIQWLPSGEYLSGYAIGSEEQAKLLKLYNAYLSEEKSWTGHDPEDGYQHILWVILALADPDQALDRLATRSSEIKDNNEFFNTYYLIHALKSRGHKSVAFHAENGAGAVYQNEKGYFALIWNPSSEWQSISFVQENGTIGEAKLAPKSLAAVAVEAVTTVNPYLDGQQKLSLSDAVSVTTSGTKKLVQYQFSFAEGSYQLKVHAVNSTNGVLSLHLLSSQGSVLASLSFPTDENATLLSSELTLEGRYTLTLEYDSALYLSDFTFTKLS